MTKYQKPHAAQNLRVAVIMRGTGHKQQEIADELGVSTSTVSLWLKGLKERAEVNGVDETLHDVFSELNGFYGLHGQIAIQIITDLEWWMNHYRVSTHSLIQRLWQLCNEPESECESLKQVVMASLPAYAEDYGFDLEKWIEGQGVKQP